MKCATCERLATQNAVLRDGIENLAVRLCEAKGMKPHILHRGMPLWLTVLPENVKATFKRR